MSRINTHMNHLPPDKELSLKMFNFYIKENDPAKQCKDMLKNFNECSNFHHGDFRFCSNEYFKLVKCIHHLDKKK